MGTGWRVWKEKVRESIPGTNVDMTSNARRVLARRPRWCGMAGGSPRCGGAAAREVLEVPSNWVRAPGETRGVGAGRQHHRRQLGGQQPRSRCGSLPWPAAAPGLAAPAPCNPPLPAHVLHLLLPPLLPLLPCPAGTAR